jgi:hypothetical protein
MHFQFTGGRSCLFPTVPFSALPFQISGGNTRNPDHKDTVLFISVKMELNGEPISPNGSEHMSDFIVLGHGSGEFQRNSEPDAESMEEVGLRIRQLLLENKELRGK